MLWLQDKDTYDRLAGIHPDSGEISWYSREKLGDLVPTGVVGTCVELEGKFVALYESGDRLIFRLDTTIIPLDEEGLKFDVTGPLSRRVLSIRRKHNDNIEFVYSVDESNIIPGDTTPFVEEEDFDFGLFVTNVSQRPDRQAVRQPKSSSDRPH